MKLKTQKIQSRQLVKHETKRHILIKFLLVLFVFIIYFGFIALKDGFYVTILTWSFFVLCTPVADAGFLLDFPFRLNLSSTPFLGQSVCSFV
jgi:hypothetical protein